MEHEHVESRAFRRRFKANGEEEDDAHEPRRVEKQEHEADKKKHCNEIAIFRRQLSLIVFTWPFRLSGLRCALNAQFVHFDGFRCCSVFVFVHRVTRLVLHGVANCPYDHRVHGKQQDKRYGERHEYRRPRMYNTKDVVEIAQFAHELLVGLVEHQMRNVIGRHDSEDRYTDDLSPPGATPSGGPERESDGDETVERDTEDEQDSVFLKRF